MSPRPALVFQVNSAVWEIALRLADGDLGRLEVVSPTEVVVHNR